MDRELGEIFEFDGEYYQVCLGERENCEECSLFQNSKCFKAGRRDITGNCTWDKRSDGNNTYFKKISPPLTVKSPLTSINFKKKKLLLLL